MRTTGGGSGPRSPPPLRSRTMSQPGDGPWFALENVCSERPQTAPCQDTVLAWPSSSRLPVEPTAPAAMPAWARGVDGADKGTYLVSDVLCVAWVRFPQPVQRVASVRVGTCGNQFAAWRKQARLHAVRERRDYARSENSGGDAVRGKAQIVPGEVELIPDTPAADSSVAARTQDSLARTELPVL
jgi:hypothetical protein